MDDFKNKIHKVSIQNQYKIKMAIKPLSKIFKVNYFYYCSVSNLGSYTSFSSNPDWNRYWFDEKLHQEAFYFLQPQNYRRGITISFPFFENKFHKIQCIAREKFNIHYVIEITYKNKDGIESYGFSTDAFDESIVTQYSTGLSYLKLFFKQFRENNENIFNQLNDNQVNIASEIGPAFFEPISPITPSLDYSFLKEIGFDISSDLSSRERSVCEHIIKGLSASEIAKRIGLSKRTVEYYIENIKFKLNCLFKSELVQKCLDLESIGYF